MYYIHKNTSMHSLQPKHIKLKQEEVKKLIEKYNISKAQLPKIKIEDPALPEGCAPGDVIKIDRVEEEKVTSYFRIVVP